MTEPSDPPHKRPKKRKEGGFTHPPVRNMTDYIVFAFVIIVATILLGVAIASIVWVFVDDTADISDILKSLADIVSAIISALIGFLAGRGQGRDETHREYRDMDDDDEEEDEL